MTTTSAAVRNDILPEIKGEEGAVQEPKQGEAVWVDVRTPSEFEAVHIPGSRNIPLADLHKFIPELREAAKETPLVLLCRTVNRVQIARDHLINNGIRNCRILEGGITTWIAEGKPVVRGRKGYSLERQTRLIAGLLVLVGVGLGTTVSPWFLIIPVAAGAGLVYAGVRDSCLMGILLGKLPFNRLKTESAR